jgi:hypothetical protein
MGKISEKLGWILALNNLVDFDVLCRSWAGRAIFVLSPQPHASNENVFDKKMSKKVNFLV